MNYPFLETQPSMSEPAENYVNTAIKESSKVWGNAKMDVAYGAHPKQKMDIYAPQSDKPLPVLVFFHGGYWTNGYKEMMGFMGPAINELPAIFISVGYRLSPEAKFPEPLNDCEDALAWIYKNIKSYGGAPAKISVGGHSVGGYFATMLSFRKDWLKKYNLPEKLIKNCFPISGVFHVKDKPTTEEYLTSSKDIETASPLNYAIENTVPCFMIVGENDYEDLYQEHFLMAKELDKTNTPYTAEVIPNSDHYQVHANCINKDARWLEVITRMLNVSQPNDRR